MTKDEKAIDRLKGRIWNWSRDIKAFKLAIERLEADIKAAEKTLTELESKDKAA